MRSRCLLVLSFFLPALLAAQEEAQPDEEAPPTCINKREVQGLWFADNTRWVFMQDDGRVLVNVIAQACPTMVGFASQNALFRRRNVQSGRQHIDLEAVSEGQRRPYLLQLIHDYVAVESQSLCTGDGIMFRSPSGGAIIPRQECRLGEFHELSPTQSELIFTNPAAVLQAIMDESRRETGQE